MLNKFIPDDTPHDDVIFLAKLLHEQGHTVIVCSGRGSEHRDVTEAWLSKHGVPYHGLYMRPARDSRRDDIIKYELLEQIRAEHGEPYMAFDDRDQVVAMWRANGVRCMQVQPGAF